MKRLPKNNSTNQQFSNTFTLHSSALAFAFASNQQFSNTFRLHSSAFASAFASNQQFSNTFTFKKMVKNLNLDGFYLRNGAKI